MEICSFDCWVLLMETPCKGRWLGWGGEQYLCLQWLFSVLSEEKLFLSLSVPIFFLNFPYVLSLFENLWYVIVGRDEVDAFKILRTMWYM